jgi:hypothetical protein
MAAIDFPNPPLTVGQTFVASNGVTYKWDGAAWVSVPAGSSAPSGPASGDLAGTYPAPQVLQASATGAFSVPGDATKAQVVLGNQTAKARLQVSNTAVTNAYLSSNWDPSAAVQDDASKPSWQVSLLSGMFALGYGAAGGSLSNRLMLDTTGKVTIPGPTASGAGADQSQVLLGTRLGKTRVHALPALDWAGFSINRRFDGSAWNQDDATKQSWMLNLDVGADQVAFQRMAAGGANTVPLYIQGSDGKTYCTLANTSVTTAMFAAGAPVNNVNTNAGPLSYSWTNVAGTESGSLVSVSIIARGTTVLVTHDVSWFVTNAAAATASVIFILRRDGTQVASRRCDCTLTAGGQASLPGFSYIDNAATAGTRLYAVSISLFATAGTSVQTPSNNPGEMQAVAFA